MFPGQGHIVNKSKSRLYLIVDIIYTYLPFPAAKFGGLLLPPTSSAVMKHIISVTITNWDGSV